LSTEPNQHPGGPSPEGYERRDASASSLVHFAVGLAVLLVVVWVGMLWVRNFLAKVQEKDLGVAVTPYEQDRPLPPLPRLQVEPVEDLVQVQTQQRDALKTYGWVDRANGVVRIPINRAMDLLLERATLPVRPNAPAVPEGAGVAPLHPASVEDPPARSRRGAP
jgi:hypothetical protein